MNRLLQYIGSINCGCADNCGGRIKLYYTGAHQDIHAVTPHGDEVVGVYRDSINNFHDALQACIEMYSSTVWGATFTTRRRG